ncbi:uncharacterized protein LOC111213305 [Brassica napus]|uniref:uncharacterized protein LOC111213305 n=1 Tax=Brassica napus TaxID=3708 RepID=UPI002078C396|nr:uncharacterized protein LOC111213305 [Brassica napus]
MHGPSYLRTAGPLESELQLLPNFSSAQQVSTSHSFMFIAGDMGRQSWSRRESCLNMLFPYAVCQDLIPSVCLSICSSKVCPRIQLAYICSGLVNIMRGRSFCYTKWHESQVQCGKEDTYREKCFESREASPHVTLRLISF